MTDGEKPPVSTVEDDTDESDWDNADADDEKARLLSSGSSLESSRTTSPEPTQPDDSRFSPPPPSPVKRFFLLAFVVLLLLVGIQMRGGLLEAKRKPKVIHASRLVQSVFGDVRKECNVFFSFLDTRKTTNSALLRAQLSRRLLRMGGCV